MLPASFFTNNRQKLINQLPSNALIVMSANSLLQRNGDMPFPFRQDSNFYYLTGLEIPDLLLVLSKSEHFIVLPKRSHAEIVFGGSLQHESIKKASGINEVYEAKAGLEKLTNLLKSRRDVYTFQPPPAKVTHTDTYFTNPARRQLINKLRRIKPGINLVYLNQHLTELRQIKSKEEVAVIEKAISITAEGIKACRQQLHPGNTGSDIQDILLATFQKHKAQHAFSPITVSGPDTCILHSLNSSRKFIKDELILLDIGAEYSLYAADISRTYSSTSFTPRQREVYDAVKFVHTKSIELLKPGLKWREFVINVEELMGDQLKQLGVIKTVSRKNIRKYFPHAIGHSLGLDAHDICDYMQPIQKDMVVTVEPGIYIPEEEIGIRIEDDILITSSCSKNLSGHIPYL